MKIVSWGGSRLGLNPRFHGFTSGRTLGAMIGLWDSRDLRDMVVVFLTRIRGNLVLTLHEECMQERPIMDEPTEKLVQGSCKEYFGLGGESCGWCY